MARVSPLPEGGRKEAEGKEKMFARDTATNKNRPDRYNENPRNGFFHIGCHCIDS